MLHLFIKVLLNINLLEIFYSILWIDTFWIDMKLTYGPHQQCDPYVGRSRLSVNLTPGYSFWNNVRSVTCMSVELESDKILVEKKVFLEAIEGELFCNDNALSCCQFLMTISYRHMHPKKSGFGFSIFWVFGFRLWVWVFRKSLANFESDNLIKYKNYLFRISY